MYEDTELEKQAKIALNEMEKPPPGLWFHCRFKTSIGCFDCWSVGRLVRITFSEYIVNIS